VHSTKISSELEFRGQKLRGQGNRGQ